MRLIPCCSSFLHIASLPLFASWLCIKFSDSTEAYFVGKSVQLFWRFPSRKSVTQVGESQLHLWIFLIKSISSVLILVAVMFPVVIGFSRNDWVYFDLLSGSVKSEYSDPTIIELIGNFLFCLTMEQGNSC